MGKTRTTLLVDGNNMLVRCIKATQRTGMSADGVPTGPLHSFISMLSRYVRDVEPDRMLVCWDGGKSRHRLALFEGYKASRHIPDDPEQAAAEDEEKRTSFALAKEFLSLANIHHVEQTGVEADDLIAAYWRTKTNDDRIHILSGDKDFLQLLDGWTEQIRPGTGADERWTANRVRTEMQCKPEHIPLVMALTGDSSDGVPGIPGFGHKTACKALAAHDWDLERLIYSAEPRWAKKTFGYAGEIRRNLTLVNLREPIEDVVVPTAPHFEPTGQTGVLYQALLDFLQRYALASVRERLMTGTLWPITST